MPGVPLVADRATVQAELDALRVRAKVHTHEGDRRPDRGAERSFRWPPRVHLPDDAGTHRRANYQDLKFRQPRRTSRSARSESGSTLSQSPSITATCAPHLEHQSREVIAQTATGLLGMAAPGQIQLTVVSLADRGRSHGIRHFKLDAWRSRRPTPPGEVPATGLAAVTLNRTRHVSFPRRGGEVHLIIVP